MEDTTRADILRRLGCVQGHVEGIRRMLSRDEPCPRLLLQAYAVRKAIQTIELRLLERHLRDCLRAGARDERARQMHTDAVRLLVHRRRERGLGPLMGRDISEKVLVRGG